MPHPREDRSLYVIRRAFPYDVPALNALMHASAAYGGRYASVLNGYAITSAQIINDLFHVADRDGAIAGFYSLTLGGEPELDLMFVADRAQRAGLGASLFRHMAAEAKRRGITAVRIVSHPPAVGFYQKMGATIVGMREPTATANWERPILILYV